MDELTWEQAQRNMAAWQQDPTASMLEFVAKMAELTGAIVTVDASGEFTSTPVAPGRRDWHARQLRAAAARRRAGRVHRHRAARGQARSTLRAGRPRRRIAHRTSGPPPGGSDPDPDAPGRAWLPDLDPAHRTLSVCGCNTTRLGKAGPSEVASPQVFGGTGVAKG
jgi:hypothetical protein